ncbi:MULTISPECIES: cytochrome c oxidase subunit 2A [Bacillales]|uniref:Cytochrome c oxidase subunit 2A n=1 Tax=Brevibacillus aydinogluensis TaxID=927786 RepID=A0AA48MD95_9BACL|nr:MULTISPECIES: cytochrome c oxidase subunit 2A [Bacillales]MBR8660769.1 cytochrome c oxidase subunit 2A [Brevibacillus sp. NL20B1]NNV03188.1 cytochrome c oxidase subunit 2A [Brevibacillus sp. MCWH]REK65508.1 MAG: cytochrome c oxidase subunit 2A [Brevibacillus sp.]MDT3417247.1 hypothetical protein [Brevibacillus aydinogluensis]UFJ62506.1 cytochrome c oxidase subunit 2A [Anoxybacillus sediminis]
METRTESQHQAKPTQPEQENLKGTFAAVLLVGAFILLSWFGVFALFLNRA